MDQNKLPVHMENKYDGGDFTGIRIVHFKAKLGPVAENATPGPFSLRPYHDLWSKKLSDCYKSMQIMHTIFGLTFILFVDFIISYASLCGLNLPLCILKKI